MQLSINREKKLTTYKRRGIFLFILAFLFVFFLMGSLFYYLTKIDADALKKYEQLMDPSQKESESDKIYQVSQKRFDSQKDILFEKNGNRMHLKLFTKESELFFDRQGEKKEIFEKMKDVLFFMQEELYYLSPTGEEVVFLENGELALRKEAKSQPKKPNPLKIKIPLSELTPQQEILFVFAKEAVYYYKTGLIAADDVKIDRFLTEGHKLKDFFPNKKPLMSGAASRAHFSFTQKGVEFKANKMKAIFHQPLEELGTK